MSVHALKSNFGKVARGVALALAMTGGASVALAQEATPAQPDAAAPQTEQQADAPQAGLPATCLPVKDLNRNIGPTSGYLKEFGESLKAYSGYQDLTNALEDAGIMIDGYCAAMYPPQQMTGGLIRLDKEETYTSLDLNITAAKQMGNGQVAIMPAPPEMVSQNLKGVFLPEAIKTMATLTARYVSVPTDNMDTSVLLSTVIQANAVAEEALYAIDTFTRTTNDEALQHMLGSDKMDLFKDEITELWTNSIDHDLTVADKNAFRVAIVTKALNDPAMREKAYEGASKMIVGLVTHGMADPATTFNTQPSAEELSARVKRLHPAYANLDLAGISAALKANPADPSIKANAAVTNTLKKFQDFLNSMPGQNGDQQTPDAPAPNL